jgi:hypothetical protein
MLSARRNEQFLARLRMMRPTANFKFHTAIHNHHDFIYVVNKILPTLTGRVRPQAATEPTLSPGSFNRFVIHPLNYRSIPIDLRRNALRSCCSIEIEGAVQNARMFLAIQAVTDV